MNTILEDQRTLTEKFSDLPLEKRITGTIVPNSSPVVVFCVREGRVLSGIPKLMYDQMVASNIRGDEEQARMRSLSENADHEASQDLLDSTTRAAIQIVTETGLPDDKEYRVISVLEMISLPVKVVKATLSERQAKTKSSVELELIIRNKAISKLYSVAYKERETNRGVWLLYQGQAFIDSFAVVPCRFKADVTQSSLDLCPPVIGRQNRRHRQERFRTRSDYTPRT